MHRGILYTCRCPGVDHWIPLTRTGHVLSLASAQPEAASEVVFISTASLPGRQHSESLVYIEPFQGPQELRRLRFVAMTSANAPLAVTLPQWQQYSRCGIKCIPCGNYLSGNHEVTPRHKARLAAWLELQRPGLQCFVAHAQLRHHQTHGYPVPEKSHLAWAPRTSHIYTYYIYKAAVDLRCLTTRRTWQQRGI